MPNHVKSVHINVPVDEVTAFASDPRNLVSIWPSLLEVKDVQMGSDGLPRSYGWTYEMGGLHLNGSTNIEHLPDQIVYHDRAPGFASTRVVTVEAENGGTKVTSKTDYSIPIPLIGQLAESVVRKQNEQEGETVLANLKAALEG